MVKKKPKYRNKSGMELRKFDGKLFAWHWTSFDKAKMYKSRDGFKNDFYTRIIKEKVMTEIRYRTTALRTRYALWIRPKRVPQNDTKYTAYKH